MRAEGEAVYGLADEEDDEIVVVCNGRRQYPILDAKDKRLVVSSVVSENNREYGVLSLQSCLKLECYDPNNESYLLLKDGETVYFKNLTPYPCLLDTFPVVVYRNSLFAPCLPDLPLLPERVLLP